LPAPRALRFFWTIAVVIIGAALIIFTFTDNFSLADRFSSTPVLLLFLVSIGFLAEYVDSSLGMGYGTTLTPVLIIIGYSPFQVVPAILFSEFLSGIGSGLLHHHLGNVDLKRGTTAHRIVQILAMCSITGAVLAVILAINLPRTAVKLYIGVMILAVGLFILLGRHLAGEFSWPKIITLGTIAALNKGISGGGYGPLVTGGQILVGVPEKNAVGITSLAEGLVCMVALSLYVIFKCAIYWHLALPLTIGALLSVPAATWTVKIMPERFLRRYIGYAAVFLGTLTIVKIIHF